MKDEGRAGRRGEGAASLGSDEVRFEAGDDAGGGLLTLPATTRAAPAVVLAPGIAGVNDYIEGVGARLAAEGYACLILDYYARGEGPPDMSSDEKIMAAVAALPDPRVLADLEAALAYLDGRPEVDPGRIGLLGFCIGGAYSLLAAAKLEGLRAAVAFYGLIKYQQLTENKPQSPLDAVDGPACPLLGHFGEADHVVPLEDVHELRERMRGAPAEIYTYPGAGHAFHEDFRPEVYRPVAAHTAWERTLVHLDWHLRG